MLNVVTQTFVGSAHLTCSGRFVHGPGCELLRQMVENRKESVIEVDLANVQAVDAAGLGTLALLHHQLQRDGRELVLLSVPEYFMHLLRLTALDSILNVRDYCSA